MFPALLAAVAAIAFRSFPARLSEAQQTKHVPGPAVSARSADGQLLLTTTQSSTSADRRRPLEAAFARESYGPGATAVLRLWGAPARITVQVFRTGPERTRTHGNHEMRGIRWFRAELCPRWPRTAAANRQLADRDVLRSDPGRELDRVRSFRASATAVGRAPRGGHPAHAHLAGLQLPGRRRRPEPRTPGTRTGEGAAFDWPGRSVTEACRCGSGRTTFRSCTGWPGQPAVGLPGPAGRRARLWRAASRRAYDLIIFPGHHEYVTSREFGLVMGFRNLGGNLMFLRRTTSSGVSSGTARSCA